MQHWVELAQLLERGLFDGLFLADVLGVYDVYGGSVDTALRDAVQVPVNDPLLIIPPMAQATEHLAFAVTVQPVTRGTPGLRASHVDARPSH